MITFIQRFVQTSCGDPYNQVYVGIDSSLCRRTRLNFDTNVGQNSPGLNLTVVIFLYFIPFQNIFNHTHIPNILQRKRNFHLGIRHCCCKYILFILINYKLSRGEQHKAKCLIQLNNDSLYPFCLLIPMLALLAYPDADYPDADLNRKQINADCILIR